MYLFATGTAREWVSSTPELTLGNSLYFGKTLKTELLNKLK
jgi:hypothetical protein